MWWLTQQTGKSVHVIKSFHSRVKRGKNRARGKAILRTMKNMARRIDHRQTDKGPKGILEAESNTKLSFERELASTRDTHENNQAPGRSGCASPLSGAQVPITSPLAARNVHLN